MKNLYKNYTRRLSVHPDWKSAIMSMALMCTAFILIPAKGYAVNQHDPVITLELRNASIKEALRAIEKQTKYNFVINDNRIKAIQKTITISIKEKDIVALLNKILEGTDITFKIKKDIMR